MLKLSSQYVIELEEQMIVSFQLSETFEMLHFKFIHTYVGWAYTSG